MDANLLLTATKEFTWDCAHMLNGHRGLCKNLHGHTYRMLVTVGRIDTEVAMDGPAEGMVVDFKDLKECVKTIVVDKFDHALVLNTETNDPFEIELTTLAQNYSKKIVMLNYRPTAENMVADFYGQIQEHFISVAAPYRVTKLRLYETPTSYAEISM